VPLGRSAPARGSGMGDGRAHGGAAWLQVGRGVGVDGHHVSRLPGFETDPYRDYSEPWFGTHKVLRGASFATRARMKKPEISKFLFA